ncbi:MAG: nucleotidyltransferase domain-containing protein [Synergistaceae bacterium]|nr:nucleotidyltransferase domain-containing protein [Synergistaceae bacterium]
MDFPARKTLDDKEMFDDIVRAILSVIGDDAVRIILYGSVARGDNTWESDVDIAMVIRGELDRNTDKKLTRAVTELDLKYDTVLSVIDIEENHFSRYKYELPFYKNIEREGITLWTKESV